MKLAYNEEKKMFRGLHRNFEIWTKDINKAIWYPEGKKVKDCEMISLDEARSEIAIDD